MAKKLALIDRTGNKYGKLFVLSRNGLDSTGKVTWNCLCDCGSKCVVVGLNMINGNTKSCGCLRHRLGPENPSYIEPALRRADKRKHGQSATRNWRKLVLSRDPVCIRCQSDKNLNVHHLLGYKEFPSKRYDSRNGVTMCFRCHTSFHSKYGRGSGFNEADFCEWIGGLREKPPTDDLTINLNDAYSKVVCLVAFHQNKNDLDCAILMLRELAA